VLRAGKFEHITPALIKLHWLPVKQRVLCKQALVTFNVLCPNNPSYLRDLLTIHNPSRNLRSSSRHLLSVGYMRTVSSSHCYKHSAATNWNDLPYDIRDCSSVSVFKHKLKSSFLALPILPSHVSPQHLRINFLLHMALYKFFVLYCIESGHCWYSATKPLLTAWEGSNFQQECDCGQHR